MRPLLVLFAVVGLTTAYDGVKSTACKSVDGTLQQFRFRNVTEDGEIDLMSIAKNKVVLVVNVATY